jgi:hypothetical protein
MAAVAEILQYGQIPSIDFPVDEPNATTPTLLTQSLTISATREEREYKNSQGCTFGVQYRNPKIEFAFDGYVAVISGITDQESGEEVTSLANFATSIFGFSPADGTMVIVDPQRSGTNEELMKSTFTVRQYPFVT